MGLAALMRETTPGVKASFACCQWKENVTVLPASEHGRQSGLSRLRPTPPQVALMPLPPHVWVQLAPPQPAAQSAVHS